jgi:hypothetical protein
LFWADPILTRLVSAGRTRKPDRYEPLPGIAELPRWVWTRTTPRLRLAVAVAALALLAGSVALAAQLREDSRSQDEAERRARAELRERREARLRSEQRPRFGRSRSVAPAGAGPRQILTKRAELLDELSPAILGDARARVRRGELDGPILGVKCDPFPRTVEASGAERDLSRRRGRYHCVAVTSELERSEASTGVTLGHPYRAHVDFESGRYAYCKVAGRPDAPADPGVTTPRACGG